MKVILIKDVKKKGKKGDILDVADGYGNNFLIKGGYAVKVTEGSINKYNFDKKQESDKEIVIIEECNKLKALIENNPLTFSVKTGNAGKIFGSISTHQIVDALDKLKIKVDKKKIVLDSALQSLGHHRVKINLHKTVIATADILIKEE